MSESLRDSAERYFQNTLFLMQKGKSGEALKELENAEKAANLLIEDPKNEFFQANLHMNLDNVFALGTSLYNMGQFPDAEIFYELSYLISQKFLKKYPDSELYQSNDAIILNNLGSLFSKTGCLEESREKLEEALEKRKKLLKKNPRNLEYQSNTAITLNNLGVLLKNMGCLEEAKEKLEEALKKRRRILNKRPKCLEFQSDVAVTLNNLGNLLLEMGCIKEAIKKYEESLKMREKLHKEHPENLEYQSNLATILNNLGYLFSGAGRKEEARQRYEKALEMRQNLLDKDSENVAYQSDVGTTLNNLGNLLSDMGLLEEAKQRYGKALEIYTEPVQYLTIGKKSYSIMKLIELNTEQAKNETNSHRQIKYLEKVYQLCKNNQEFFNKYGLKHEKKLVMEAGLSAYVDYVIKDVREEKDSEKRAEGYEKAIKAIEKLGEIEDEEEIAKIASSTVCYLEGRKLVNEALGSEQPNLELIKQATNQFKDAKETYKKANVCYCIYIGLLQILENVELFEEENGSKAKEMINQVIEILPENIDPGIKAAFEEIAKIFDEKDIKSRKKHLEEFDGKIRAIEYKALENLFGHVQKKLKDYIEEPFSPNLFYNNWKLRITFDAEKIKGKLTVKTGNRVLFDQVLSKEEIKDNEIEIDFLERRYIPSSEDRIIFETPTQKPVIRNIDYSETISKNKKARIFLHDCCNGVCTAGDLKVAVVQLKYDVYGEDYAVKILENEAYKRKVMSILEAVKEEADIVVFPEFSIPFDYLEDIQEYANETGIIVFAGTHYVTEENLEKYEKLFAYDFEEGDFRKNICPITIPNSKIIHSEKMFGAKEERDLFFHKSMKQGKVNHIFKLRDNLNLGVLICFEYLNDELRHRLISACDVILVPQTNPNPSRFYGVAKNDLNSPLCAGNKACIMANGIFRIRKTKEEMEEVLPGVQMKIEGGSSGVLLTLDKDSYKMQGKGIISHVKDQKEQFILLATINTQFSASRDVQPGHGPIKTSFIHIFEEKEIRLIKNENITKENTEEFLALIGDINACKDRQAIKTLIEKNSSLIEKYSPLMHENTENLNNLDFEEIKEKCRCIFIPAS